MNTLEELNRVVTDHLSDLNLVSSRDDLCNLTREGLGHSAIFTGDIVRDLVPAVKPHSRNNEFAVVATLHREENTTDDRILRRVFDILSEFNLQAVFFAHPRILKSAESASSDYPLMTIRESCSHQEILELISQSQFIVTDSGALQREAYYLHRRAIVVQNSLFWSSLIDAGVHWRCDGSSSSLRRGVSWAMSRPEYAPLGHEHFGSIPVGETVVSVIVEFVVAGRAL